MRICAVIPAAGRGTRLGLDVPKILVPVNDQMTVWHVLRDLLLPHVEHVHVVLSPPAMELFQSVHRAEREQARISASVQEVPRGMGDAIFGSHDFWKDFDSILIVWGDQVNLSHGTVQQVVNACQEKSTVVLPLTRQETPYVQYDFEDERLMGVRQSREHDRMDQSGDSDVGAFALSVAGSVGSGTGEINFTPFMPYLSRQAGWRVVPIVVPDVHEARGINTPDDLEFARQRLAGLARTGEAKP
jgi:bifunctional UDP-N-acetylglucosamine pyrophosphorylase/glucosamine-1-phosphate N-acetyltransferase